MAAKASFFLIRNGFRYLALTNSRASFHNFYRLSQRTFYTSSVLYHNFDGEVYNKTNISLLTNEDETHTYVEAYSPYGFRLSSGFRVLGPCAVFPKAVLHWNVASSDKITPESLALFCMLEPKLDILILGIGDRGATYDKNIIRYLRSKKMNVEILPTEQACSTFNFLNSERRVVAAGLIPPTEMGMGDDDDFVVDDAQELKFTDFKEDYGDDLPENTKIIKSIKKDGVIETFRKAELSRTSGFGVSKQKQGDAETEKEDQDKSGR